MTDESRARARMTIYAFLEGKAGLPILEWWMADLVAIVNRKMDMYFQRQGS